MTGADKSVRIDQHVKSKNAKWHANCMNGRGNGKREQQSINIDHKAMTSIYARIIEI